MLKINATTAAMMLLMTQLFASQENDPLRNSEHQHDKTMIHLDALNSDNSNIDIYTQPGCQSDPLDQIDYLRLSTILGQAKSEEQICLISPAGIVPVEHPPLSNFVAASSDLKQMIYNEIFPINDPKLTIFDQEDNQIAPVYQLNNQALSTLEPIKTAAHFWLIDPTRQLALDYETTKLLTFAATIKNALLNAHFLIANKDSKGFIEVEGAILNTTARGNSEEVTSNVTTMLIAGEEKYVFDFDGDELVYFTETKLPHPSHHENKFNNARTVVLTKKMTHLSKKAIREIVEESINKLETLQANHFAKINGRIFLDTDNSLAHMPPDAREEINKVLADAKRHEKKDEEDELKKIEWNSELTYK